MGRIRELARELRRRRVFRTAGIYVVGAWVLLQVVALAFQSFDIPDSALRYVWIAAVAAFPLVLVFGWRYDVTADGIVRTLPCDGGADADYRLRRPDYLILGALFAVALVVIASTVVEIREGARDSGRPWYEAAGNVTAIAVLPLENLSGDNAQEFLAAGLHDALITTLSRVTRFRVTSRYSTRRVDRNLALGEIAERLGVDKLLAGSVLRDGDSVRVNVELLDAATERPLWTESFTREFDGLIPMQNEIASSVAREVKIRLTPEETRRLAIRQGPDSATYEAYLRGMFQLRKGSPAGYRRAIEIFTEAVENEPTSALAYAGLAIGYAQLGHSPYPVAGAYPRAKAAAEKALEYDPELAEAHLADAMYRIYYEWDFAAGETSFLRALEFNPSLVDAHYHYAWLLELLQRDDEAIAYGEHAREINPLSPFYASWLAEQYRDAGLYEQAIEEAETVLALNPDYPVAWLSLGQTFLDLGRVDDAIAAHEHLRGNRFWGFYLASTLAAAGREEDAGEVLEFIEKGRNNGLTLTLIYAGLGDVGQTFHWLEKAREDRIPWYPWLLAWYPQTRFLYGDPRLQALAAELGLALPDARDLRAAAAAAPASAGGR